MIRKPAAGFTIVEISIVVIVIVILVAITSATIAANLTRARDTARESDVATIMNALEKYYDQNGEYPYNIQLNPSQAMSKLPDYSAVKTVLPSLTDADLGDEQGYNFWTLSCGTCNSTSSELEMRAKQYIYFSAYQGTTTSYLYYPYSTARPYLWGCQVEVRDGNPGYVLAWRSESTGIWTFKKSKRGNVTISDYGSTRPPVQTCTLS